MANAITGGCRCGKVRYACSADPVFSVYCHCRDCQYSVGGAYAAVMLFPRDGVKVEGDTKAYTVTGDSGGTVTRRFCPECGTPLFGEISANAMLLGVKAGTLDDPKSFAPQVQIWTNSAQPWSRIPDGIMSFAENPPQ